VKVSWQVTGIRQDAFANANRIPLEVEKEPKNRGLYLHPSAFGLPEEQGIGLGGPGAEVEATELHAEEAPVTEGAP
ncbi:MAG TPA: hypothetical protein VNT79_02605, partial [Phycisphaerae bacterium]|nr:hypothetical protein [Phycisphaerae bacterium]